MARAEAGAIPEIEEFDPPSDWATDEASDTLIVMLQGFKKEQLTVQLTSTSKLKIRGERQIEDNRRRRFSKQLDIPEHCDTNRISAKFENGLLYVKLPKLVSKPSVPQQEPPATQPSAPPPEATAMPKADEQKPLVPQQEPPAMPQPSPLPPPLPAVAPMPKADQEKPSVLQQPQAMPQPPQPPPPSPPPPPPLPTQMPKSDQQWPSQEVMPPMTDEVTQKPIQKEKEQESGPKWKDKSRDDKAKKFGQEKKKTGASGFGKKTRSPRQVLPASPSLAYREAFVGFMEGLKRKKEVVNLVLAILFVLVLVLYVKDAIKSSSGGSNIQDL